MKIYIDFDNTIVDSTKAFVLQYNHLYKKNVNSDDITEYDFSGVMNFNSNKEISKLFTTDLFYEHLMLYNNVEESLTKLKELGCELVLVTNCSDESAIQKIKWFNKAENYKLNSLFDAKIFLSVHKPYDKSMINMDGCALIDDHKSNHIGSNATYKFAYKDNPSRNWYPTLEDDNVIVKYNWLDIVEEIEKIIVCQNKDNTK